MITLGVVERSAKAGSEAVGYTSLQRSLLRPESASMGLHPHIELGVTIEAVWSSSCIGRFECLSRLSIEAA